MSRLPNILTVLRIVLAVFFVIFITQESLTGVVTAAVIFFLASLTDYYDGYFAKKHKVFSNFGVIMDPIADKFLILAAFFIFMQMELVPEWMFLIIFVREVVVTGSRLMAMRKGRVIAADPLSHAYAVLVASVDPETPTTIESISVPGSRSVSTIKTISAEQ